VIAMTPRDQQGAEEDCLRAGATALLERPVQPQALKSLLEQFLAAENPEAPGPPS
jgi:CheY-like chemotaxis protein